MVVPEKPGFTIKLPAKPKGARWAEDPKVITRLNYRRDRRGYRPAGWRHLFVVDAEGENQIAIHPGANALVTVEDVDRSMQVNLRAPVVLAPYDAELFGHWWYEGPWWLEETLRQAATGGGGLRLTTMGGYLAAHPAFAVAQGRHEYDGMLPDWSAEGIAREIARQQQVRQRALAFDGQALGE